MLLNDFNADKYGRNTLRLSMANSGIK